MSETMPEWKYGYEKAKAQGKCVRCRKQDAYTMIGKTLCADCMNKMVEANRKYREKHKDEIQKQNHEKTLKLKQEGKCIVCHRREAEKGYTMCNHCRNQAKARKKKWTLNNGKLSIDQALYCGLCARCRKKPHIEGKKLCPDCYQDALKGLEKANVDRTERNKTHIWHEKKL